MNYSLRKLLLFALLSASLVILGAASYKVYSEIRKEVSDLFDAELAQSARSLNSFVAHLPYSKTLYRLWDLEKVETIRPNAFTHRYEKKLAFQLIYKQEGMILRSESAPALPLSTSLNGYSKTTINGHLWHVFSISDDNSHYIIHVGQRDDIRKELKDDISKHLITPFLIGLPCLGVVIWLIVGRAWKPVERLTKQLAKREANYLKPLSTQKLPAEIVPLVNQMNNLFIQLEHAFEHERRFTADASHELRTPLAGLLTQAQVALRAQDEQTRNQALSRIEQGVNRMTAMVQQLLIFSRIESGTEFLTQQTSLIGSEVVQVVADLEPEAHKKKIRVEFVEDNAVPITGNSALINILIRNLVGNAIKYTPPEGLVRITVFGEADCLMLSVEDSGPGIPPSEYENVLKRFHRCIETSRTVQGSGLGLSIVQRIALIHGAKLSLDRSQFGGLKVSVEFALPNKECGRSRMKRRGLFGGGKSDSPRRLAQ